MDATMKHKAQKLADKMAHLDAVVKCSVLSLELASRTATVFGMVSTCDMAQKIDHAIEALQDAHSYAQFCLASCVIDGATLTQGTLEAN
jgi:hypothetical protein